MAQTNFTWQQNIQLICGIFLCGIALFREDIVVTCIGLVVVFVTIISEQKSTEEQVEDCEKIPQISQDY